MNQVFVYGTLKKGHYNHRAITMNGNAKQIPVEAFVYGEMFELGPYPAIIEGKEPIKGEVWEVDDQTLERLDHLEGHPTMYVRQEVDLLGQPGHKVFAYYMPKDRLPARATKMKVGNWPLKY